MVEKHPNLENKANPELYAFFTVNNQRYCVTTSLPMSVVHPPQQAASDPHESSEQESDGEQPPHHDKRELNYSFEFMPQD